MLWVSFQSMAFAPVMRSSSALHCSFSASKALLPDERHLQFNMDGIVQPGDMVQRLKGGEIMLQGWVLEIGQCPGDHRT
ncbi:Uncharacterised protein [Klebsiella pneumoniae]|nr:Uncharacterised protein [Klebsiella pneumoniae]